MTSLYTYEFYVKRVSITLFDIVIRMCTGLGLQISVTGKQSEARNCFVVDRQMQVCPQADKYV